MCDIANLLNQDKDKVIDLFADMYNAVLVGNNQLADRDLFLALENNDFQKAKEIYETVYKPFFELKANCQEAA